MSKQDPYRFNLRFDDTDSDHQKVCDFLNSCGRKKTRYIVKAFLAYWGMAGAKGSEEQRKETVEPEPPGKEHFVTVEAKEYTADDAEVSLVQRNYQMFDNLGREEF